MRAIHRPGPAAPLRSISDAARLVVLLAFVLVMGLTPGRALAEDPVDLWYTLWIDGVRSGHARQTVTIAEDRITTSGLTSMTIKRGPITLDVLITSTFVETLDGEPIWATSEQRMGAIPSTTTIDFKGDELVITRAQGGATATETVPAPETPWLPPAASQRMLAERLRAGAKEVSIATLDPSMGAAPVVMLRRDIRPDTEEVGGRTIETRVSRSSMSNMPDVEFTEEFDTNAEVVRTETVLGGIRIDTRLADEASALAPIDGGAEIMLSTLVNPSRPIDEPRTSARASFLLTVTSGTLPDLPETGSQRFERIAPNQARVHIDARTPSSAPEADIGDGRYGASSLFCRADDEEIERLVEKATRNAGKDPAARAEAIRRFVHSYLNRKSLDVGFASASETARSRAGDCSEHAVLLAAMLRADGIPARGVSGLVYVDEFIGAKGVFGYHMWTQALLSVNGAPAWVDLDAAIDGERAYDATHIACSLATYSDDETVEAFQTLVPLMGVLKIDVETVE